MTLSLKISSEAERLLRLDMDAGNDKSMKPIDHYKSRKENESYPFQSFSKAHRSRTATTQDACLLPVRRKEKITTTRMLVPDSKFASSVLYFASFIYLAHDEHLGKPRSNGSKLKKLLLLNIYLLLYIYLAR